MQYAQTGGLLSNHSCMTDSIPSEMVQQAYRDLTQGQQLAQNKADFTRRPRAYPCALNALPERRR